MGAIKLIQIDSYKPCLTEKDIESAYKSIMDEIDIYNHDDYKLLKFECANGITIHVEVNYGGCTYRRINLQNVYVMYKVDDEYKSIEEYEHSFRSLISDRLYELNSKAEEEYEVENQYTY